MAAKTLDSMTDLETYGTDDDSVILSIGAIAFDPFGKPEEIIDKEGKIVCPSFYRVLHIETQKGRTINKDTVAWWQHPDRAVALRQLQDAQKVHLVDALSDYWDWMKENCRGKAWACAPDFDIGMLSHALKNTGVLAMKGAKVDFPARFWDYRDVRTIEKFIFGSKFRDTVRKGTYHNAVDDCVTQALMVQEAGRLVHTHITPTLAG
jgi:hypothetical protein